jgi:hypothetical protein
MTLSLVNVYLYRIRTWSRLIIIKSKLAKVEEGEQGSISAPWELVPPELEVYRERGHRRLAARTYDTKCYSCM